MKDRKRRALWSLNEDILKITVLKTNTPYPSRRYGVSVPALTNDHKRNEAQYAVSRRLYTPYSRYGYNLIFWKISNVVPTPRNPQYAETDIQKRTKNKAKNDKTEHGMEKCEKTKPNQSQKVNQVKKSTEQSNSQSQSQPRQSQSQLRETEAEKTTWGTTIAKSQSCILRIRTTRTEVAIS
ncbi:hypothetical protein Tco_0561638 [Tanacetum coccineum]